MSNYDKIDITAIGDQFRRYVVGQDSSGWQSPYEQARKEGLLDLKCTKCAMVFEHGKAYGYCCSRNDCPIQAKSIC